MNNNEIEMGGERLFKAKFIELCHSLGLPVDVSKISRLVRKFAATAEMGDTQPNATNPDMGRDFQDMIIKILDPLFKSIVGKYLAIYKEDFSELMPETLDELSAWILAYLKQNMEPMLVEFITNFSAEQSSESQLRVILQKPFTIRMSSIRDMGPEANQEFEETIQAIYKTVIPQVISIITAQETKGSVNLFVNASREFLEATWIQAILMMEKITSVQVTFLQQHEHLFKLYDKEVSVKEIKSVLECLASDFMVMKSDMLQNLQILHQSVKKDADKLNLDAAIKTMQAIGTRLSDTDIKNLNSDLVKIEHLIADENIKGAAKCVNYIQAFSDASQYSEGLLIGILSTAYKFSEDDRYLAHELFNKTKELTSQYEIEVLKALNYKLYFNRDDYLRVKAEIVKQPRELILTPKATAPYKKQGAELYKEVKAGLKKSEDYHETRGRKGSGKKGFDI